MHGLCNIKMESLEILKTHLVSSEVYELKECFRYVNNLNEIKLHIENVQDKTKNFYHLKMNRKQNEKVDIKEYVFGDI